MRKLLSLAVFFFLLTSCHSSKAPDPTEKRKVLAMHDTLASFDGLKYKKCLGRTTQCPEKCGHSGEFATFTILKYHHFKSESEYGKKQENFRFQISDFNKRTLAHAPTLPSGLKKGDEVKLTWKHEYVIRNHSLFPEYTVTGIIKVHK